MQTSFEHLMEGHFNKKRRAVSGLMQVAMIVGIVIIFSGVLFTFAGDIFSVQTVTDSISLQKTSIQKVGNQAFISANVKNTGNSDITGLEVRVMVDTDSATSGIQPFVTSISPTTLVPGMTGSAYERIVDSAGADIALATGSEIAVILNATTTDGSVLTDPITVRVR